jgi:acyl-CoA thioester hydrolase
LRLRDDAARQLEDTYPLRYTQRLLFSDVDALRHLNNGAVARFFEEGRAEANLLIFRAANALMADGTQSTVLARLTLEFLREGHYPGDVQVCSGIASIGTTSITHAHAAFQNGACIAIAEAVMVKFIAGQAVPLSDQERSAIAALMIRHT